MLSELQKRKLTALFHRHDRDGDGFLTKADYEGFAKRVCELWDYAPGTTEYRTFYAQNVAVWDYVREVADKDKDDRVSLDEFLASYAITLSDEALIERNVVGYATTSFQLADRDRDGKISRAEFVALLECYGAAKEMAQEAFRRMDADGAGYLTAEQMVQGYKEFLGDDPDAPGNWVMGPY